MVTVQQVSVILCSAREKANLTIFHLFPWYFSKDENAWQTFQGNVMASLLKANVTLSLYRSRC